MRRPVQRAIDAAERVSHGDFSARMGTSGPEELVKLGRAFDEMAARLEQADRDQREFLADVAHEIAMPVNAVSGFALAPQADPAAVSRSSIVRSKPLEAISNAPVPRTKAANFASRCPPTVRQQVPCVKTENGCESGPAEVRCELGCCPPDSGLSAGGARSGRMCGGSPLDDLGQRSSDRGARVLLSWAARRR